MTLKVKLKSIYRRYKEHIIFGLIFVNILSIMFPPYSLISFVRGIVFIFLFSSLLYSERRADIKERKDKIWEYREYCSIVKLWALVKHYQDLEWKRIKYCNKRFSAQDQFLYDGKWHNVASVNFQEGLIAYDISSDEDDDLQLVWIRFENIESYIQNFKEPC